MIAPGTVLPPLPDRALARHALGLPATGAVVAYVGRVTGIKRPDRLVAVAQRVCRAVPGTTFVVCGAGGCLERREEAAQ